MANGVNNSENKTQNVGSQKSKRVNTEYEDLNKKDFASEVIKKLDDKSTNEVSTQNNPESKKTGSPEAEATFTNEIIKSYQSQNINKSLLKLQTEGVGLDGFQKNRPDINNV